MDINTDSYDPILQGYYYDWSLNGGEIHDQQMDDDQLIHADNTESSFCSPCFHIPNDVIPSASTNHSIHAELINRIQLHQHIMCTTVHPYLPYILCGTDENTLEILSSTSETGKHRLQDDDQIIIQTGTS